ncbi:MAG: trypsin-like peptidase domain-containing protein [Planctomycetes bacterium]|nr:trypsin-like peptidase domain-containing protein [Planctomycetota bacterium]
MRRIILLVLGCALCVVGLASWVLTQDAQRITQDVVIVKAGQPRHPYQDEYERMLYPTVRISSPAGTGSGVIFTTKHTKDTKEEIYILTACHVVENETTVSIELYNATVITGMVVVTDTVKDLALIRINRDCFADARNDIVVYSAQLAPTNYKPYLFTPVWTVGCSLGLKPRPSFGHLSALCDLCGENWEISAPVLPGNSGGPVYDARTFEVIGIAVWVKTCQGQLVTTMAGIVPINQIYEFLEGYKRLQ